jgi:hypothetical protein
VRSIVIDHCQFEVAIKRSFPDWTPIALGISRCAPSGQKLLGALLKHPAISEMEPPTLHTLVKFFHMLVASRSRFIGGLASTPETVFNAVAGSEEHQVLGLSSVINRLDVVAPDWSLRLRSDFVSQTNHSIDQ